MLVLLIEFAMKMHVFKMFPQLIQRFVCPAFSHEADTGQIKLLSRCKAIIQSPVWLNNNLQVQQFHYITL